MSPNPNSNHDLTVKIKTLLISKLTKGIFVKFRNHFIPTYGLLKEVTFFNSVGVASDKNVSASKKNNIR